MRVSGPLQDQPHRARSLAKDHDLASAIGERVEGLLANLARRAAAASARDVVPLADNQRFLPAISVELIGRLGVDPYGAPEFLDELRRDLTAFAAAPRVRSWGTLESPRGKLVLKVRDSAGLLDFSELFERPWSVTT